MDILPLIDETLDSFLLRSKQIHKEAIALALQRYDKDLCSRIDRDRFVLIRLDDRTILSSYGALTFRRRYYYDKVEEKYCHLLDNALGIPKSKRMTNELIIRMMELASIMSYKEAGEHLSDEFAVSKYTVWKTINESLLETHFGTGVDRKGSKIHVQVDEKFIGMTDSTNKRKYYTLTIFAGREEAGKSHRLLNKTVISSSKLCDLKDRLSELLTGRYGVSPDEEVFVSGDLAAYIQGFGESIACCRARYVPDRFHVYRTLRRALPDVFVDDRSLNDEGFRRHLAKRLAKSDDDDAKKLRNLLARSPRAFEPYLDPEYLGCSQEGQNSHVYAPRFGKYANRFSPSTIEKLSLIREARAMGAKVVLAHRRRKVPDPIDLTILRPYEDIERYVLDTRGMKYETAKMFNAIKYGEL